MGAEVGDDVEESDGTVLGVDPGAVLGLRVGLGVGSGETLGVGLRTGLGVVLGVGSDVNTLGVGIGVGLSVVRVGSDVETLRIGLSVGLGVGLSVDPETLGAGVSCPATLATRREREIYRKFILLSGFWVVSELCEWVQWVLGKLYFCCFDYSLNNYFYFIRLI